MVQIAEVTNGDMESSSQLEYFTYLSPIPLSGNPEIKSINNDEGAIDRIFGGSVKDHIKEYHNEEEVNLLGLEVNGQTKHNSSRLNWLIIAILNVLFNIAASESLLLIVILFKTRKALIQILRGTTIGILYGLEAMIYLITMYHKSIFVILEMISSWMNIPYFGIRSSIKNPSVEKIQDFNPQLSFATLNGIFWSDVEILPDKMFRDIVIYEDHENDNITKTSTIDDNENEIQEPSAFRVMIDKAFNILYKPEDGKFSKRNNIVYTNDNEQENNGAINNHQKQLSQPTDSRNKETNIGENSKDISKNQKLKNIFQANDKSNQISPSKKLENYLNRKQYKVSGNNIIREEKLNLNSNSNLSSNSKTTPQKRRHRLWGNEPSNNIKKQVHALSKSYDIEVDENKQRKLEKKFNQKSADITSSLELSLDNENNNTVVKRDEKSAFVPINSSSVINLENYDAEE